MFKPGDPKPPGSGRQKGQPNNKNKELEEILTKALGKSLPESIADDLYNQRIRAETRLKAKLDLMDYIYARRKAVEVTGEVTTTSATDKVSNLTNELEQLAKES